MRRLPLLSFAVWLFVVRGLLADAPAPVRVAAWDFETDAYKSGWVPVGQAVLGKNVLWTDQAAHSGVHGLCALRGEDRSYNAGWESPPFKVTPDQYYRLTLFSRATGDALWCARFYDEFGQELEGDSYSEFEASADWRKQEFMFRAKFRAATATVAFHQKGPHAIYVDDVAVETATRPEVAQWCDRVYATMPPLPDKAPADAGALIPRTIAKLRKGGPVRFVLLGDSISNDLANSAFETLIERDFPAAQIETRFTGRGATGWRRYKRQLQERVVRHKPDLVVLLALSNDEPTLIEDFAAVVQNLRRELPEAELLLITNPDVEYPPARPSLRAQRQLYIPFARENRIELIDAFALGEEYLAANGKTLRYLLRDAVHSNARGGQFLARVVAQRFAQAAKRR